MTLNLGLDVDRTTWTRVRFDEIALNVTDRVDDPSAAGVDRYVGLEHLDPGSMTVNRWGSPEEVAAQKLRFQPGDVIFGRRRAYQKRVAQADFEGICSAHALVLRARAGVVSPEFLAVFLSSDYFLDRAISISVGSLSPTVNWRDLARQEFDLPPLDEQHRIADLLWAVERHGHSIARTVASVEQSRMRSFRVWLNGISHWALLGQQFEAQLGKMLSARSKPTERQQGVPYLANINVRWGYFDLQDLRYVLLDEDERNKFRLARGDVLVCEGGEIGRAAIWDGRIEDCYYQKALHRLRPTSPTSLPAELLVTYLRVLAEDGSLGSYSTGTTFAHLTRERLIQLPVPSVTDAEARRVLKVLRSSAAAEAHLSQESTHHATLRSSLLNGIFGGSD